MAYTPELTKEASCNLRRLAWAMGIPMTSAIQQIFTDLLPLIIDNKTVCNFCKDKTRCETCGFYKQNNNDNSLFIIEENEPEKENKDKKPTRIIKKKCA